MVIKGLEKLSLSDFPGYLSCVVFTPGCSLACPFCHNRELVKNSPKLKVISEKEVFEFLDKRKGILEGVVVTGGEPTLQPGLLKFLKEVKNLGYKTKLDTNGTKPSVLEKILKLNLADFIAIDVKTTLGTSEYKKLGLKSSLSPILRSLKLASQFDVPLELRTTVVPKLHQPKTIEKLARRLSKLFGDQIKKSQVKWVLQTFRPGTCLDEKYNDENPYSKSEMKNIMESVKPVFSAVLLR
jgi:pyruvate formate lyase activating enzyme